MKTNLEIIKSLYLSDAEQTAKNLQAALAPNAEWVEVEGFPYGGTYHGLEEVGKNVFSRLATEWIGFRADVEHIYDAGDTIVSSGFYRATYKETNREMHARFVHMWTLKDGKIVKYVQCADTKKVWDSIK